MRLSWNEIRIRAADFAREWEGQGYEKGQTQLFYQGLFTVFGMPIRRVAAFEEPVKLLGDKRGFIDLFWKGVLLVEQKSIGRDLTRAKSQALEYFPGLKNSDLPRYVLVSDFQTFELYDLDEGRASKFALKDLPKRVEKFAFILGVQERTFRDQDPVNIKAAELVGSIHDALEAQHYTGHDLERFLVRIVFCLFADDTGIFEPKECFRDLLESRTQEDGSDLGGLLSQLFQVLNTPEDRRQRNLDEDLAQFPYVNGELFNGPLSIPSFNADLRERLIEACSFDWSAISPAIFGSLFQSVMDPAERRRQGAHYTTEKNILKVIQPLFLDELRAEFQRLNARKDNRRRSDLAALQKRLRTLRFLDPACGCGNFLIITYREIRLLELDILRELNVDDGRSKQLESDVDFISIVDVDQFYGIELGEFASRIAETAMWMMDHIMNNRLSLEFGQSYVRIPLRRSPHITNGDALDLGWQATLPASECSFVLGNPPFAGAKYQSDSQRAQVQRIAAVRESGGSLDYVAAWFLKAGEYLRGSKASIGFVATNSISQGEQVGQLWPILFDRYGLEIVFAHRTFAWGSDARGKAHVHVVIIGLDRRERARGKRRLFSYETLGGDPHESEHTVITPYLLDGSALSSPRMVVQESAQPTNGLPRLTVGSQPIDDGQYVFTADELSAFLKAEPGAREFVRPFIGSREFIEGVPRYILWLADANPTKLAGLPHVRERIAAVRTFRAGSRRAQTLQAAATPTAYYLAVVPTTEFLVIPKVSSERREYVPVGWVSPPTIPSDLLFVLPGATLGVFGLLTSAMHMSWLRHVGGRLKSDYRYSVGLVYNTFPCPSGGLEALESLTRPAQNVVDERKAHHRSSFANLYDPDSMPVALRKAHRTLDTAVDRLYRRAPFASDRERAEHLFALYESVAVQPQLTDAPRSPRRRGARRRSPG